jgi:hypothetical protein
MNVLLNVAPKAIGRAVGIVVVIGFICWLVSSLCMRAPKAGKRRLTKKEEPQPDH